MAAIREGGDAKAVIVVVCGGKGGCLGIEIGET